MSGHNKWSKIKHKKAVTDAQKSKVFSKHSSLISMESKKAGGDVNSPSLASAIEHAKKDSMPKENIEKAIAKGSGAGGATIEEVMYETYGPGGVAILITALTDNVNRTSPEIRHLLSRVGLELGTPGSSVWAFTKTGDTYTPNTPIELSGADNEKLVGLIETIKEHEDVQNIFTTAGSNV